jgi:hypothetical protein
VSLLSFPSLSSVVTVPEISDTTGTIDINDSIGLISAIPADRCIPVYRGRCCVHTRDACAAHVTDFIETHGSLDIDPMFTFVPAWADRKSKITDFGCTVMTRASGNATDWFLAWTQIRSYLPFGSIIHVHFRLQNYGLCIGCLGLGTWSKVLKTRRLCHF